jgi:cystathionine gamma-synthase
MRPETVLVWVETPTNPLLASPTSRPGRGRARRRRALVVDNTFASPTCSSRWPSAPTSSSHSTTKYLGGHSDVVGGALVASDPALGEELAYHQNAMGGVAGAFDSWLVPARRQDPRRADGPALRERRRVVELLQASPAVAQVLYPGCPSTRATTSPPAR